ncbi:MAG: NAD(+) diphosphatase [Spirochaetia bacterium]|nr:NAD(+) diphosphatase [Spirochaetia bacterium]
MPSSMHPPARFAFRGPEVLARSPVQGGEPDPRPAPWPQLPVPEGAELFPLAVGAALRPGLEGSALAVPPETPAPEGHEWAPLRSFINAASEEHEWFPAARALALANWRAATRFCGRCGSPNGDKADESARLCPACGALQYPRLSPAVLALVRKGDRILLARNARSPVAGMQSILAGFVEPGETFEDCVVREVREEVGIEVANARYAGSQPWPFPDSLMVGFECDWVSGELAPDGVEIVEAGWYGPDAHPLLPGPGSLSRRLVERAFTQIRARSGVGAAVPGTAP